MSKKAKSLKKKKKRAISRKSELIKAAILLILIAAILRIFVVLPYHLPDDAMRSGLFSGDYLLTSKLAYKFNPPEVNDIVVFDHPFKPGEKLARRVIATEGQTVQIVGKMVYVNDEPFAEQSTVTHSDYRIFPPELSNRDYSPAQQVPSGQIFVLADNRDKGEDSREFGFIDIDKVRGKEKVINYK